MKKNCQIWDAEMILSVVVPPEEISTIVVGSVAVDANGDFVYTQILPWKTSTITSTITIPPDALASVINMPLWEVVMVDHCGDDVYALLFYED